MRLQSTPCSAGSAAGSCGSPSATARSPPRSPPTSPAGTTAAGFHCTPPCTSRPTIAPASNACCATAPAPLELLDRLATLIPPPRRHRHHYAGVFVPHASLRARVTACAGQSVAATAPVMAPRTDPTLAAPTRRRASLHWARLLARIYEIQPLTCPRCHGPMRLIAFLTEPPSIRMILAHLGEPTTAPVLAPHARATARPRFPLRSAPELITHPAAPHHFRSAGSLPMRHDARGGEMLAPITTRPPPLPPAQPSQAPATSAPVARSTAHRVRLASSARAFAPSP